MATGSKGFSVTIAAVRDLGIDRTEAQRSVKIAVPPHSLVARALWHRLLGKRDRP